MPLITHEEALDNSTPRTSRLSISTPDPFAELRKTPEDNHHIPEPNTAAIFGMILAEESYIPSMIYNYPRLVHKGWYDPDFDPYHPELLAGYEEYQWVLGQAINLEDFHLIKKYVAKDEYYKSILPHTVYYDNSTTLILLWVIVLLLASGVISNRKGIYRHIKSLFRISRKILSFIISTKLFQLLLRLMRTIKNWFNQETT